MIELVTEEWIEYPAAPMSSILQWLGIENQVYYLTGLIVRPLMILIVIIFIYGALKEIHATLKEIFCGL